ncbi:MAG: phosphatidylglycerol lysyltransferase domain-containing protein [Muribaculaceae bacterium]|nr:phosphatidylglycerol lysyltransferase domain-containing protein [Muribaculaceae bacterium]
MKSQTKPEVITVDKYCPLSFKPLTIDAIPEVRKIVARSPYRTCDYSVGGLFMWVDWFNYEYCIYRDTLFIRGLDERDRRRPSFAVPMGAMSVQESVALLKDYCASHNCGLLMSAVPQEAIDSLLGAGAVRIERLECWGDYLYGASDLAELVGKAYNKKRNHVNRFMADNPGYVLEPIGEGNLAETQAFFATLEHVEKVDEAEAEFERMQCADVLARWNDYGFEGAVLRDGSGAVVAFTAAEAIGDTLIIHIEKMDHNVPGAGETINKLFAEYMTSRHPEIRYINREDDAGDPGLRRAKESYHPLRVLEKFNVEF